MTNREIITAKEKIYSSLNEQNNINLVAFPLIKELVDVAKTGELSDELDRISLEYKYLLQYFAQGISDDEREQIFYRIIEKLYELTDKAINIIRIREDYTLYYSVKRTLIKRGDTLQKLINKYNEILSNINIYLEVDDDSRNDIEQDNLFKNKESIETDIFKYIWTSFPLNNSEIEILGSIFESDFYPEYFKCHIVSAILLSQIQFYNESLLNILLSNYNSPNTELSVKSLCAAIIIMFIQKDRIAKSNIIMQRLRLIADNTQSAEEIKTILFLLIRAKNTENITKKVENELMPKLMKIYPNVFKKFKSNNVNIDLTDIETNPQWKEMLENDGITKKIEELNKLQMEGGDVFIGTFSHLKSFPFFNEISNWFIPFHRDHTIISDSLKKEEFKLIELIIESKLFCDSDKYSFIASMTSVPESQRNMMLSQLNEQNNALQEIKNSELPISSAIKRETIANLYIQNIYRFFKLHSQRQEFIDPFSLISDIYNIKDLINDINLSDLIETIGEFYLKHEHYSDAIKFFSLLQKANNNCNPIILQKIGFCYQNMENYHKAIDSYKKYELLADKDLWNLRHLAVCYRALKRPDIALKYYKEAELLSPDNISICTNIGHCLLELERYNDALKYYYKVYYMEPNSSRVWRPIAWCLFVQTNLEQSKIYYEKIINDKPTATDYMNYGHLYFVEGDIKAAISMYQKSIETDNQSISKFYDNFISDEKILIKSGIKKSDISLLINSLSIQK